MQQSWDSIVNPALCFATAILQSAVASAESNLRSQVALTRGPKCLGEICITDKMVIQREVGHAFDQGVPDCLPS